MLGRFLRLALVAGRRARQLGAPASAREPRGTAHLPAARTGAAGADDRGRSRRQRAPGRPGCTTATGRPASAPGTGVVRAAGFPPPTGAFGNPAARVVR